MYTKPNSANLNKSKNNYRRTSLTRLYLNPPFVEFGGCRVVHSNGLFNKFAIDSSYIHTLSTNYLHHIVVVELHLKCRTRKCVIDYCLFFSLWHLVALSCSRRRNCVFFFMSAVELHKLSSYRVSSYNVLTYKINGSSIKLILN